MKTSTKNFLIGLSIGFAIVVIISGIYLGFKHFSYWLFYEDMVKQTIHELIKQTAFK
jgi:hypothetical protein